MEQEVVVLRTDRMDVIRAQVQDILATAGTVVVEDDDQAAHATTLLNIIKTESKKAEDARKEIVQPHNDAVREFNAVVKDSITNPLADAEKAVKAALRTYLERKEEIEREAREKARREEEARLAAEQKAREDKALEEAARLQAEGRAEEAEAVLQQGSEEAAAIETTLPEVTTKAGPVRGSYGGSASLQRVWAFRLDPNLDPHKAVALVPDAFKVAPVDQLNGKVIRAAISGSSGVREIPGLEIYQETRVAGR